MTPHLSIVMFKYKYTLLVVQTWNGGLECCNRYAAIYACCNIIKKCSFVGTEVSVHTIQNLGN